MYTIAKDTDSGFVTIEGSGQFDDYDSAFDACGELFDRGERDDFMICDESGFRHLIRSASLAKKECPICRKEFRVANMEWSADCYGIRFRLLCPDCLNAVYAEKGFDGERYTEYDECIDYDY